MPPFFTAPATLAIHRKPLAWLARHGLTLATLLVLTLLLAIPHGARAQPAYPPGGLSDPPGIVARLNLAEGEVSFAPADANPDASGWTPAVLNRPLTTGDRLWSGPSARSELHIGSTAVRMNEQTSLDFVALNEQFTQLWVAQGSVQLRVRTLFEGERLEVDTPNLAFVVLAPGNYRIDVNPASGTTRVVVLSGVGVLYGDSGATLNLANQQQGNFSGTQLMSAPPAPAFQDSFYAWSAARDRREDQSVSARYIPRETIGYLQLDRYGDWQQDPSYGAIWLPRAVPANWAPYRNGNWSWISPWGWTWVDDAPWGFAPFHYGRWAQIGPRWAWVPGQLPRRPVYAPALVAFIGGGAGLNWNIAAGSGSAPRPAVGWFPLAPGEAFRPVYRASPRYITQVNNNITVNSAVNITNNYRYQRQPAAVTAIGRDDFFKGHPQQGSLRPLNAAELGRAQLLVERSALPPRPDARERPRLAPAAALPPAALLSQPAIRSRPERIDPRTARPENHERNSPPQGQALPAQPPAVQLPALRPLVTPLPGRAGEADQRVQREQARQQEVQHHQNEVLQQSQQAEQARQQDQQRRQAEQAQAERIQHEQALQQAEQQRQQGELARQQDAQRRQRQALQQRQRNQERQQAEQARQQDQQRRQAEEAQAERSQQEQALRQGDLARQQDAQRRQNEALQQHQQMQIQHEQALQQQQQHQQQQQQHQQQRAIQQEQRRVQPQQHQRPPAANAADERAPRPEGQRRRNQEP